MNINNKQSKYILVQCFRQKFDVSGYLKCKTNAKEKHSMAINSVEFSREMFTLCKYETIFAKAKTYKSKAINRATEWQNV